MQKFFHSPKKISLNSNCWLNRLSMKNLDFFLAEIEGETKRKFRRKVWVNMIRKEAVNLSSNNAHNRIPNFIGAAEAAKRLSELEEFKQAKVIKISPDKPQESVKNIALENDKEILVPKPRLKAGLFNLVRRVTNPTDEELKNVVTRHGIQQIERLVGLDADLKVSTRMPVQFV